MHISPDAVVWFHYGWFKLNSTIVFTWVVMTVLVLGSCLMTRRLRVRDGISRRQHMLETVVGGIQKELGQIFRDNPSRFLPFVGTLFLFVGASNILSVAPGFDPPTGSLSTTAGLAICVFLAVPAYGIARIGAWGYLRNYLRPTVFMLPFNVMGEISRTLALAVRLFGNVMSGTMIGAILLSIAPLVVPVIMQLLGLLTGVVQAYIFSVLAAVYISAGMEVQK